MQPDKTMVEMALSALESSQMFLIFLLVMLLSSEITCGEFSDIESLNCTNALSDFAGQTADFTHCAIVHARPITLCESCASNYMNVTEAYDDISKLTDQKGVSCRAKLINVDRLEIIEKGYMFVQNLWRNGHCDSCYESNGTAVGRLSNSTLNFFVLVDNVTTCISNHYSNESEKYDCSVCSDCAENYIALNSLYEELKISQGDGNICVDIVDSVNSTRVMWSHVLVCDKKEMKWDAQLLGAVIGVSVLPIIFYVTTRYLTRQMSTRLTQQKRLVQTFSINSPSTSN